jgi:hypothetical protein
MAFEFFAQFDQEFARQWHRPEQCDREMPDFRSNTLSIGSKVKMK